MNRIYPEGLRTEILEALAKNDGCDVSGLGPNNVPLAMLATKRWHTGADYKTTCMN